MAKRTNAANRQAPLRRQVGRRPQLSSPYSRSRRSYTSSSRSSRRPPRKRRRLKRRLIFLGIVVAFIAWLFLWGPFATKKSTGSSSMVSTGISPTILYQSPYSWDNLVTGANGSLSYEVDGQTLSRFGIDVSEHQGSIDWSKVSAAGVQFAYIRVGYRTTDQGTISSDDYATQNLSGATNAGLMVGVYFYSQAINEEEAQEEADFVLKAIDGYDLSYPIVFDFEPGGTGSDRISTLDSTERTAIAVAFCEEIEKSGLAAMVYGNGNTLSSYDLEQLASRGFWYASYESTPSSNLCFALWQYSNTGSVDGIDGDVDLDIDLTPALNAASD